MELNNRYGNPETFRLVYILIALLAMALAGGAPTAYPTGN
jgi:hypothetical protein